VLLLEKIEETIKVARMPSADVGIEGDDSWNFV
jgi:hypothetical protein